MKKFMIMSAKERTLRCLLAGVIVLIGFSGSRCLADPWEGPLTGYLYGDAAGLGTDGLVTTDGWMSADTYISWNLWRDEVSGQPTGPWHYEYTFHAPPGDLSHFILQVSYDEGELGPFDPTNLADFDGELYPDEIGFWGPSQGNPTFPEGYSFYGIKFDETSSNVVDGTWTVQFDSWRNPMKGSFYGKDGNPENQYPVVASAWNSGLEGGEDFIPVPNGSYVPVPGAILLGILGLGAAGMKLRKFV